ncbi:MAG TPA: BREX-6 system phosphatase PglZ [Polyangiaceae bacterium]|nr:BREX-6 system phosphatase PglZ [Polyangiaceae bacterium]
MCAAAAGLAIAKHPLPLKGCASLEEVLDRYTGELAEVDRLHRTFEQRAHALITPELEDYDQLLEARGVLRATYRDWADGLGRAFAALCRTHGALPPAELRQRQIFGRSVKPLVEQGGRVAFFMVDALRFEMAQALSEELKRDKFSVALKACFAELPTITSVGMNALAPVERQGRLELAFDGDKLSGLRAQGYAVKTPAERLRAMREATGSALDFELETLSAMTTAELKRALGTKPGLVVVRSRELDDAGEVGLHLGTFDHTLTLLRSAVSLLQQAGVERFVIASDHGFLLQDSGAQKHPYGSNKRVADRRHVLATQQSGMPDVLEVPLAALEYDAPTPQFLVFRPDTALWDVASKVAPFVHGGNSLQERVIPVLFVERHGRRGKTTTKYEIVATPEVGKLGRQRLRLSVRLQKESSAALSFHAPKAIALALRVSERLDVQLTLLDVTPPAKLADGRILLPPNGESALVEFELEGEADEKLRVEVFHPDAVEDVEPKMVEGFFDVFRNRRLPKPVGQTPAPAPTRTEPPPSAPRPPSVPPSLAPRTSAAGDWQSLIEDQGFREVLLYIEERRSMNEVELGQKLGSSRRVRAFTRAFDALMARVPFAVEIMFVSGLKTYVRKD